MTVGHLYEKRPDVILIHEKGGEYMKIRDMVSYHDQPDDMISGVAMIDENLSHYHHSKKFRVGEKVMVADRFPGTISNPKVFVDHGIPYVMGIYVDGQEIMDVPVGNVHVIG